MSLHRSGGLSEAERERLASRPRTMAGTIPRGAGWQYRCERGHVRVYLDQRDDNSRTHYRCQTCEKLGYDPICYRLIDVSEPCKLPRQGYEQIDVPVDSKENPLAGAFGNGGEQR